MCICDDRYFYQTDVDEYLGKQKYDLGVLGALTHDLVLTRDDDCIKETEKPKWSIASEVYHPEIEWDDLSIIRIPIKYCPFCGRKL